MGIGRRWLIRGIVGGLGLGAIGLAGCQTYPAGFGGMTLPSPHYLKHYPQYFPPDPAFPLQRELDSMQDPGGLRPAPGALPLPEPLPPPGQFPPPAPVNPQAVPPPIAR